MRVDQRNLIVELAETGVELAVYEFSKRESRITGFALCVDDGMGSVYHVATDLRARLVPDVTEFLRTRSIDVARRTDWAVPVEWKISAHSAAPCFSELSAVLYQESSSVDDEAFEQFLFEAFELLSGVLVRMRSKLETVSAPELELLILLVSSAGSDEERDPQMVRLLNSNTLAALWLNAVL